MMKRTVHNLGTIRRFARRGFTLIEAAMVTVIIGVGVVAMLQLLAAGSMSNSASTELTTGLNLANNVREMLQTVPFKDPVTPSVWGPDAGESFNGTKPFNDLNDFHNLTLSPPRDARRQVLSEFTGWAQHIRVQSVDENRLTMPVPNSTSRPMARVTITVFRNNRQVCAISWLAVDTD
jgi:prepilin-type N-terminal cleavage/methylation domain-containing protein